MYLNSIEDVNVYFNLLIKLKKSGSFVIRVICYFYRQIYGGFHYFNLAGSVFAVLWNDDFSQMRRNVRLEFIKQKKLTFKINKDIQFMISIISHMTKEESC